MTRNDKKRRFKYCIMSHRYNRSIRKILYKIYKYR